MMFICIAATNTLREQRNMRRESELAPVFCLVAEESNSNLMFGLAINQPLECWLIPQAAIPESVLAPSFPG
jgi:hypothetical protein